MAPPPHTAAALILLPPSPAATALAAPAAATRRRKPATLPHLCGVPLLLLLLVLGTGIGGGRSATGAPSPGPSALPATSDYANVAVLDPAMELFWSANSSEGTIHVALRGRTSGWVAFGISEVGSMLGSDVMVAWVSDGTVYATDRFIFDKNGGPSSIPLDDQQDWVLVGGREEVNQSTGDTWTEVHAWRKLATGDCNDREIVAGQLTNLVWAMGTQDSLSYHGLTRGATSLVLVPAETAVVSRATSASAAATAPTGNATGPQQQAAAAAGNGSTNAWDTMLNLTFSALPVSVNSTSYMCKVFDLNLTAKAHVVEWGSALNSTNTAAVHHALIYGCDVTEYANLPPSNPFECRDIIPCTHTIAMWALGGRPFIYPPGIGFPIGPGAFTKLMLQLHYTNPDNTPGMVDSSGIYLKLNTGGKAQGGGSSGTSGGGGGSAAMVDAGVMVLGPSWYTSQIRIPAGNPSWTQQTVCPSICTAGVLKNGPITVLASSLHLHTLGRQLKSHVYRNGAQVATLHSQEYYYYGSQQTVPLYPQFELQPGDEIRTSCVWDSSLRTNVTVGGPAATDEMCVAYVLYYPASTENDMYTCMDFCGAIDSTGSLSLDPSSPNRQVFYNCGRGPTSIIPTNQSCTDPFGSEQPLVVTKGCPNQTKQSVADFPTQQVSLTASPPSAASALHSSPLLSLWMAAVATVVAAAAAVLI